MLFSVFVFCFLPASFTGFCDGVERDQTGVGREGEGAKAKACMDGGRSQDDFGVETGRCIE